ncbi:MAG: NADH-quinone oxidoreductase subunit K [Acidobacteriota bacterium]|jgi:multisubunit Na+/H+ antiporter MnhC subunit|nr:NADH-quinone oxidoreductase subunit K [Acidobacteriota bacterium]
MTETWYLYMFFAAALVAVGLYALLTMRNIIRLLIAVGIIGKGISLALLASGWAQNLLLTAQSLVITFIVVEVCLVAVALALAINAYRHTKDLDVRKLTRLKG